MNFSTPIIINKAPFQVNPTDRLLFVGSCFADNIGKRFTENRFRTMVNPYGVMYNPASILHTVERLSAADFTIDGTQHIPDTAVFTLGTNHVYILKETNEIVDNCQKRPQKLFREETLSVSQCAEYLQKAIAILQRHNPDVRVILTVSPIRYAKYGFHGSRLSKATLLLAIEELKSGNPFLPELHSAPYYFPAYEIMNDELRDYRFHAPDMIHPSEQAVEYIYERFAEVLFSPLAKQFVSEWQPIKSALAHRPFNPDSEEYAAFLANAKEREQQFLNKYIQVSQAQLES